MIGDDRREHAVEMREPARERRLRVGPELAVGDVAEPIALSADDPPAGGAEPGIEAEDDQFPSPIGRGREPRSGGRVRMTW
jgi:hypothetical protein